MKLLQERDEILFVLYELDEQCQKKKTTAELILLGGAAIFLFLDSHGVYFRPTRDIDVNIIETSNINEMRDILRENQIDIVGGVMELPPMEDFINSKKYLIDSGFTNLRVYVPSIELLACAKIFSAREKDLLDLRNSDLLKLCDIDKLMEMVEEYKDYVLNFKNLDLNFHELACILEEKRIY